jgi:hypothetical protein
MIVYSVGLGEGGCCWCRAPIGLVDDAASSSWSQYTLERNAAGGRGVMFALRRATWKTVYNGVDVEDFKVKVELFGPGIRHQVALHLERNGRQLESDEIGYVEPLKSLKSMSCDTPPILWDFKIPADAARGLWCILSWVEPSGDALWTYSYARKLMREDDLFEWRWYRTRRIRRWLQALNLRVRPLGRWRRVKVRGVHQGQGSIDGGQAPR